MSLLKYQVNWWDGTKDFMTEITVSNDKLVGNNRCSPSYRIPLNQIRDLKKCIPNLKILAAYHNPKGDDFVMYENNICQYIGYGTRIGNLKPI